MGSSAVPKIDGRRARSERSQAALIDALLELLREGGEVPSSREIAEAAGVTQRTLFNHFEHLGQLFAAAQEDQIRRVMDELPAVGPEGPLADRLDRYVAGMRTVLEENAPIYWIAYTRASDVPDVAELITVMRELGRAMVERAFSPELDALDHDERGITVDALELSLSSLTWHLRRDFQQLSRQEAGEAMRLECTRLLTR
jgi:AcrR family transcriptional regulator